MTTAVIAPPLPDAPYRGIEPFRFTDQQIFAAREDETWTLLSNVTLYRAVLLFGESGTGKSSLVNAGFLPQVLKENYVPDRLRVQPIAGREFKVERIRMSTEGDQPTYLPSNFVPSEVIGPAESFELSLKDFRARLEEFRPESSEEAPGELFLAPRSTARPLLIFDQFEEFITLFEEAQRVGTSAETTLAIAQVPAAQQDILATLVELIQDETLPVKIIFSFREDYLAKLSILFDLCPELLDQAQRLLPPGIEALAQIIRAPFNDPALRAHFLQQKGGAGSELSEKLAGKIAQELGRRSKGDTANLTELQIVCQRLWEANDPEKLFAENGIEGLLTGYGADVFRHFTPELRSAAVVLLSHMVTASNTRNIVSEEDLLSRTAECDFNSSQCSEALGALSRSQIVRREPRHSIYFYEITSEYLVPWIKEQVAERKSAEEQRLAEETRQKLEQERAQAIAQFETEKRRGRLMKRLLRVMGVLGIAVVLLGWWGLKQYRQLRATETETERQRKNLQELQDVMKAINSSNLDVQKQGVEQFGVLINENRVPSELKSVLISTVSSNEDPSVRQAAYKVLTQAAQNDGRLSESIVKAAESSENLAQQLPPRFHIHYTDDSQRQRAEQIAAALKKRGYVVPGIQKKIDKDVKSNQLRYFRRDEPGMPTPDELLSLLRNAAPGNWRAFYLQSSGRIRPGHFEIWFPVVDAPKVDGSSATPPGTLVLTLTDQEGNRLNVSDAKITLTGGPLNVNTGLSGGNQFGFLEGNYEVVVEFPGYVRHRRRFSIKDGATSDVTMKLVKVRTDQQSIPTPYQFVDPADQKPPRRNP